MRQIHQTSLTGLLTLSSKHVDGKSTWRSSYPEKLLWQVSPLVDASVHRDEAIDSRFVPHIWIMEACVQHDDGK